MKIETNIDETTFNQLKEELKNKQIKFIHDKIQTQ